MRDRNNSETCSLHSLTKLLKSLLVVNCVMDRTSLGWAHIFKNGLSCDKTSRCYDAIFDFVTLVSLMQL